MTYRMPRRRRRVSLVCATRNSERLSCWLSRVTTRASSTRDRDVSPVRRDVILGISAERSAWPWPNRSSTSLSRVTTSVRWIKRSPGEPPGGNGSRGYRIMCGLVEDQEPGPRHAALAHPGRPLGHPEVDQAAPHRGELRRLRLRAHPGELVVSCLQLPRTDARSAGVHRAAIAVRLWSSATPKMTGSIPVHRQGSRPKETYRKSVCARTTSLSPGAGKLSPGSR